MYLQVFVYVLRKRIRRINTICAAFNTIHVEINVFLKLPEDLDSLS